MREVPVTHERFGFDPQHELPEVDLVVAGCRAAPAGSFYDLVDFRRRAVDRWTVPPFDISRAVELLRQSIPTDRLPFGSPSHEDHFRTHYMAPHTAQLAPNGRLFVGMGDPHNGFCILVIDTHEHRAWVLPDDFDQDLMLYSSTGGFTPDGRRWAFARWPFQDSLDIAAGRRERARCAIGWLDTASLEMEIVYELEAPDRAHQVTCSPDGRHLVFAPFRWEPRVPYPAATIEEDPAGYRRSHEAGIPPCTLVTVDVGRRRHWETPAPVPVIAHAHFDPLDGDGGGGGGGGAFYLSAHNISPTAHGMMVEGPAALYKMRIGDGETRVEGAHSDEGFFRISQHAAFCFEGRTVLAVTNPPNRLDLIDGARMTPWRRRELSPAAPLDLRATGNAICPACPEMSLSLAASRDGRYVVLESARSFRVYDVAEDRLLDAAVPHRLPEGGRVVGHLRVPGA